MSSNRQKQNDVISLDQIGVGGTCRRVLVPHSDGLSLYRRQPESCSSNSLAQSAGGLVEIERKRPGSLHQNCQRAGYMISRPTTAALIDCVASKRMPVDFFGREERVHARPARGPGFLERSANVVKRSGFYERPFQARQSRLGMAS